MHREERKCLAICVHQPLFGYGTFFLRPLAATFALRAHVWSSNLEILFFVEQIWRYISVDWWSFSASWKRTRLCRVVFLVRLRAPQTSTVVNAGVWTEQGPGNTPNDLTNSLDDQVKWKKNIAKRANKNDGRLWGPEPNKKYYPTQTGPLPGRGKTPPINRDISPDLLDKKEYLQIAGPYMRSECEGGCQWSQKKCAIPEQRLMDTNCEAFSLLSVH